MQKNGKTPSCVPARVGMMAVNGYLRPWQFFSFFFDETRTLLTTALCLSVRLSGEKRVTQKWLLETAISNLIPLGSITD
jgi:hypothetical protein